MALVNPQIAMSYRPTVEYQPRNALAEYAQVQQIVGGQRQAEMADMQMEALRRKERAISQIQAAAVKHGGPTDRREIAQAYIKSGVPEFMQIGLTMDKDLDELEAFDRIMGGGAAAPAPRAAAPGAAPSAAAAAPEPVGQLVAEPIALPRGVVREIAPGGAAGPEMPLTRGEPAAANALAPAAAPSTNAMLASAQPAGAETDPVAALRSKRDAFIRRGTTRSLQAAKSLDADIALLSRTTSVAPGSTVIGPDGKLVYQAAAAPSPIAVLEAEIAALKKAGATENDTRIQSRRRSIEQTSGQSTELIRNYNAAVASGFDGTIFDYERQIKQAGRAITPPTPAAPVAVVDPASGNTIYVSREEALKNRMTPAGQGTNLTPKQIQTFEAKYPQATSAVKTFESKADKLAADLETLANHPGLSGISGLIYGRTPALTAEARQAEALYDSIIARGGFQELQDMRAASPTGGALGPVSNTENQYLRDAFAPIKRTQDTPDLKQALLGAAQATKDSKQRVREAYDLTYEYRAQRGAGAANVDQERANARAAIAAGAPEAAVRKRFKEKTGQEF